MKNRTIILLLFICFMFLVSGCVKDNDNINSIESKKDLIHLLERYQTRQSLFGIFPEAGMDKSLASQEANDYSKTNTQELNIDEADIVKTDGNFIYMASYNKVLITKVLQNGELSLDETIVYDNNFVPSTLYIKDNKLVVIGQIYDKYPSPKSFISYQVGKPRIYIYDTSDYSKVEHTIDLEGYLVTTRLNDKELLLISSKYININYQKEDEITPPIYKIDGTEHKIQYEDLYYKENTYPGEFISVHLLNIDNPEEQDVLTYVGSSHNVYVSEQNIYVAQTLFKNDRQMVLSNHTVIAKIPYGGYTFGEMVSTEVKGYVLNQFSMDEHEMNFRVATTSTSKETENNVYIFDPNLSLIGKVEGIAKGETIQSARFLDERIYLVTFRQIDPFFVIDVKDPTNPKILGELKIPGYSTYLHPYDENHIIGFGFDTTTISDKGGERTFVSGLKMSLFDVTDPMKPVEKFNKKLPFGEHGYAYSSLTYDHKALLFSKSKSIIAFPFTIYEYKYENDNYTSYYNQTFKVFNIDQHTGFTYKTDISHFNEEELYGYHYRYEILRGLYINDYLYTVSQSKIMAHRLGTYQYASQLKFEIENIKYPYGPYPYEY